MVTEHLKQAAQDAADVVTDVVGSAKDAVADAKDAVVDDAAEHSRTIDTVQTSLEGRAEEREQAARRTHG